MTETLNQEYYDELKSLRIYESVYNTMLFSEKEDAMLSEVADEHGTTLSAILQSSFYDNRIRPFENEYLQSCKGRFESDIQAKKFKTEDEWIDYQTDLIESCIAYAKSKINTLDWSELESDKDGEMLTPEEKVAIVEDFTNYSSWIDDESMGMSIVDDINYEVAEEHQISSNADIQSLFWDEEPIASQSDIALEQLRSAYAQRAQNTFRDGVVKTHEQYNDFVKDEQNEFTKDWRNAVKGFAWDAVQENVINTLLDSVAPEFPDTDVNELRQKLIELYPDCSAYDVTSDEAIGKLQNIIED